MLNEKPADSQLDQQRLHSLVNSMADGVLAVDEAGSIVLYNGATLNILDLNGEIKGRRLSQVMKVIDSQGQPIDIDKIVQAAKRPTSNRDLRLVYPDTSTINLYLSIAPVHLGYGVSDDSGYVVLMRDITHEKSLEEERNEFISVISHELRTPVAIAEGNIGNAQFIAEKQGDPTKIAEALKTAHDQIMFLSDMINDLSTLSRAERGKLRAESEPINVADFLNELRKNYLPDATRKGLELRTAPSPHLEILSSSKLYVREVLQNFITNAIKYTDKGSVTIGARQQSDGVLFEVSDTGIGISHGDQSRIFDKFFRSDNSATRAQTGTGLGLYVTQKLAKILGAKITLESEIGHGSTFQIFIPNLPEKKSTNQAASEQHA